METMQLKSKDGNRERSRQYYQDNKKLQKQRRD